MIINFESFIDEQMRARIQKTDWYNNVTTNIEEQNSQIGYLIIRAVDRGDQLEFDAVEYCPGHEYRPETINYVTVFLDCSWHSKEIAFRHAGKEHVTERCYRAGTNSPN